MKINKIKQLLPALLSMGMTFIVLGVLMLAASFIFGIKNNILAVRRTLFHCRRNSRICIFAQAKALA